MELGYEILFSIKIFVRDLLGVFYSIVKDSSADLGVNFKISMAIFWYFWEKIKRYHFFKFLIFKLKQPFFNQDLEWLWALFGLSIFSWQIRITVLNYTVGYSKTTFTRCCPLLTHCWHLSMNFFYWNKGKY